MKLEKREMWSTRLPKSTIEKIGILSERFKITKVEVVIRAIDSLYNSMFR